MKLNLFLSCVIVLSANSIFISCKDDDDDYEEPRFEVRSTKVPLSITVEGRSYTDSGTYHTITNLFTFTTLNNKIVSIKKSSTGNTIKEDYEFFYNEDNPLRMEYCRNNGSAISCQLNGRGFISYAGSTEYKYNEDGQLTEMAYSYSDYFGNLVTDGEVYVYENGDLISKTVTDGRIGSISYYYTYTSNEYPNGIANTAGIHYGNTNLMAAGLLGTASARLPLSYGTSSSSDSYNTKIEWTLDNQNYPVKSKTESTTYIYKWY